MSAGNQGENLVRCIIFEEYRIDVSFWSSLFQCDEVDEIGDWIYVGATDIKDKKLKESNYGEVISSPIHGTALYLKVVFSKCVDIYAPGANIQVAGSESDNVSL